MRQVEEALAAGHQRRRELLELDDAPLALASRGTEGRDGGLQLGNLAAMLFAQLGGLLVLGAEVFQVLGQLGHRKLHRLQAAVQRLHALLDARHATLDLGAQRLDLLLLLKGRQVRGAAAHSLLEHGQPRLQTCQRLRAYRPVLTGARVRVRVRARMTVRARARVMVRVKGEDEGRGLGW